MANVSAPTYETIQKQVKELVRGKIIVGHAAFNDLAVRSFSGNAFWADRIDFADTPSVRRRTRYRSVLSTARHGRRNA